MDDAIIADNDLAPCRIFAHYSSTVWENEEPID